MKLWGELFVYSICWDSRNTEISNVLVEIGFTGFQPRFFSGEWVGFEPILPLNTPPGESED